MNKKIEHIFFDLDHTLWDFEKNSFLAFEMIFDKFNIGVGVHDFLEVYRPINFKYWKLYREEKVNKEQLRRGRLMDTFKLLGKSISVVQIDTISDDYVNFLPLHNNLIDGTKELLEYLTPRYELHIITNGFKEIQNDKLQNSGIKDYFSTVTNSEEVGVKKPNPLIFETALQKSKAIPSVSMMIGDNYEADIQGAEAVGLHTICFNYHKEKIPPSNIQVSQLIDIKRLL
ncbi:YjjG family noncanonical pyrimidine nucleotidase [Aquimarina algicola]|uniref:Noncanonical pyrimidine nucleotidase, YjjG family n=1 Tax=Aquimarina algicola TaxID=2589995 RepID=A0A504J554_9FLAO|nr:YjjG family noncanonical pyrimidine nucleotidase [Aquimarina algicola]TPN81331.1 noncanonical pyrimidine nucleotidase, YjjG family [Aquimarina algicola]